MTSASAYMRRCYRPAPATSAGSSEPACEAEADARNDEQLAVIPAAIAKSSGRSNDAVGKVAKTSTDVTVEKYVSHRPRLRRSDPNRWPIRPVSKNSARSGPSGRTVSG